MPLVRQARRRFEQDGQTLVFVAILMAVLLGFGGLVIDIGIWMHTRTELQKDVDAMVLGGARKLCGDVSCNALAEAEARSLASPNGLKSSEIYGSILFDQGCDGESYEEGYVITIRARRTNKSFLAQMVGVASARISTCATAG